MNYELDDLDKKIILQLSEGVYSYAELAEKCETGRNTVYRRINRLEKLGIIDRKLRAIPSFTKLGLSAICVMMDIVQSEVGRVVNFLGRQTQVKFLWKTFGTYNVTTVILCKKGEEGMCISNLREILEKMRITPNKFETSVSYSWEKIDLSPPF